ncbi:MAG: DUF192 domain-containing protein [Chloroflexota bacterium]
MARVKQTYRVLNTSRNAVLAERSGRASTFLTRGAGLTLRKSLPESGGLIIEPCASVGTFLMRFRIDVLFVSDEGEVMHLVHAMPPWRASKYVRKSHLVIELPAGTLEKTGTETGDHIEISSA